MPQGVLLVEAVGVVILRCYRRYAGGGRWSCYPLGVAGWKQVELLTLKCYMGYADGGRWSC